MQKMDGMNVLNLIAISICQSEMGHVSLRQEEEEESGFRERVTGFRSCSVKAVLLTM